MHYLRHLSLALIASLSMASASAKHIMSPVEQKAFQESRPANYTPTPSYTINESHEGIIRINSNDLIRLQAIIELLDESPIQMPKIEDVD